VADFRNWKIGRFWRRGTKESERLDAFLKDLSDPGLIESLKGEERRRSSWRLVVAALLLGLFLGGGATAWWLSRRPAPSSRISSEDLAHALSAQGLAFTKAKEIYQAWSHLRLAIEMRPNLFDAWAALGLAQLYGGQMGDAEHSFRRCTQIDPGDPRGFQGLGDVYFALGDSKRAEEYWLKGNANRSVSRLRLLQGRFNDAAPLIQELVRQTPDQLYVQTMSEALSAGRLTPELRWRLEPGIVGSRSAETARGWRLYFAGQYEDASGVFRRVLADSPGDASARIGRGWCGVKARDYKEAREDFERVLAAWPSNYSALNGLGWSLKALGRPAEAAAAWRRVLELNPENPEAPESLKGLGMLAFERGDFPEADHGLTQSLLQNPYDQETRTLLGEVLKRIPADEM
jgi:tetratricopeptide (TPR) repeat protein